MILDILSSISGITSFFTNEKRSKDHVYTQATQFIQKYNTIGNATDILLLPLCVIAYKYNSAYPYHREIYREFCVLTEEVQNCILKRQKVAMISEKDNNFYQDIENTIRDFIEKEYNQEIFDYEDYENIPKAFFKYGNMEITAIRNEGEIAHYILPENINELVRECNEFSKHGEDGDEYQKKRLQTFMLMIKYMFRVKNDPIAKQIAENCENDFTDLIRVISSNYGRRNVYNYLDQFKDQRYVEDLFLEMLYIVYVSDELPTNENNMAKVFNIVSWISLIFAFILVLVGVSQ